MKVRLPGLLMLALICAVAAHTQSLWTNGSRSLYVDPTAHAVGDLLTVYISTNSTASASTKHATSKDISVSATPGTGMLSGFDGMGVKAGRGTNGTGASTSSTQFLDRLTVTVTEVLPNGNLRVSGDRTIQLGVDTLTITFGGIVRLQDIGPDNCIYSWNVADLSLVAKGAGPIAEKQRPGLFSRLLSWLW